MENLPTEVLTKIINYLSNEETLRLKLVSRYKIRFFFWYLFQSYEILCHRKFLAISNYLLWKRFRELKHTPEMQLEILHIELASAEVGNDVDWYFYFTTEDWVKTIEFDLGRMDKILKDEDMKNFEKKHLDLFQQIFVSYIIHQWNIK